MIEESFRGATEELSDVRELIPEFFCLPDFLINQDKLDFGQTPIQLFTKPHPQRLAAISPGYPRVLTDSFANIKVYKAQPKDPKDNKPSLFGLTNVNSEALMSLKILGDSRLIGLRRAGKV